MAGEWTDIMGVTGTGCYGTSAAEDRQLELTLGPPGRDRSWGPGSRAVVVQTKEEEGSSSMGLSLGLFSKCPKSSGGSSAGGRRGVVDADETCGGGYEKTRVLQHQQQQEQAAQKVEQDPHRLGSSGDVKACVARASAQGAVTHARSQARTTTTPVVGWPPIRSFRKNITTSSRQPQPSKPPPGPDPHPQAPENPGCGSHHPSPKGVFVKINMDGIPIGRKVDLKACDGYDSLSAKVDKLFRGLLQAAQKEPRAAATAPNSIGEETPVITGLLDGTGEYTLVYEDEEGDRILVGDVPWEMFVTTAKRLRVLKTSELSKLSLGATCRKRAAPESGAC